uniref:E1 ubiquitin-activating enzyme n=1 Tax=Oryza meridionalis TaxID=40149 RepID=A0A0E0EGH2_9ORYZ
MRCLRFLRRGLLSMLPTTNKRAAGPDDDDARATDPKRPKVAAQNGSTNGVVVPEIDEDLHSRQLAVYGRETMRRLFASHVLVSGLNGLGAEIAKNLALAGVKSVTLHDVKNVEMWDLSANFFLSENDIGKNRAAACVSKLQELNNAVIISALTEELTTDHLSKFQAVVFTDIGLDKAYEFDDCCHNHCPPISFIKAEVCGLFGTVFCDFGPEFTVLDVDGEDPHTGIIASISNDNPAMVSCVDDERLEFQDGDFVVFSEVHGMSELNDGKPRKVKEPKILRFKSLRDAMRDPGDFLLSDFSKFERSPVLHLAFQALDKFKKEYGRNPAPGCEQDAQSFLKCAADINEDLTDHKLDTIDEKLFRHFASGSQAVLNPMAAMFGGIVGQEVVKACSGKFHPLYQKKLEEANTFVVGSGALGCEFLKNLALMGVSCSPKGKLTITDDDVIEKSNLSRQFLFRDWNIGQAKSTVAAAAASAINPNLCIDALQNRACPDTENVFHDTFWEGLDVVVNALDNVNARMYMDMRCLYFQKALLESGTLGAKCNTQMVIPHLTENYGASRDPPEKQAPIFEDYFSNRVKQLTFTFPEDAATSTGAPFWSAPKRFPRPLQFSVADPSHIHFIVSASILRAESFGIAIPDWAKNTSRLADAVSEVAVPQFEPKKGVSIVTDEKATSLSSASVDDASVIDDLLAKLEECAKRLPPGFQMKPIQFEKDDDTNFHMDLISGFANMRARNYSIPEVDKLKAKFIAGRIIPAIATSTAMATGLVCLELYKVIAGEHPIEDYRNTFANLALPLFSMAEPVPPKVIKHQDMSWTVWDRWSIKGNLTVAELLQWFSDKGLTAYSISCGTSLLYNNMFARHKERLNKKVVDVAREVAKVHVPEYRKHLDLVAACEDDDGNDIDIPLVSVYFR